MNYIVGVTRKTNSKVSQWVADDGYTSNKAEALVYTSHDEATRRARAESDSKYRGVVQKQS